MDKRYLMLIEALDGTPKDLRRLVKPLNDAQSLFRPAPTEWCVRDVIAHLADIEDQFRARLMRMVAQENPHEPFISPHPERHDLSKTVAELIETFATKRNETTAFLSTLENPHWLRICTHDEFGVTRLRKQVELLVGHDNEHLAQLVDVREKMETGN